MPPYKPVVSKAQARALLAKAQRREISMAEAKGKVRAAKGKNLPERKGEDPGEKKKLPPWLQKKGK